jgi:hypothetical protein
VEEFYYHLTKVYYFKNNIIITIIQFDLFQADSASNEEKFTIYISTGNEGVDNEDIPPGFALTI